MSNDVCGFVARLGAIDAKVILPRSIKINNINEFEFHVTSDRYEVKYKKDLIKTKHIDVYLSYRHGQKSAHIAIWDKLISYSHKKNIFKFPILRLITK